MKKKDEQLQKFSRILKATKTEYQKIHKENIELRNYILNQRKNYEKRKQKQKQQLYQKQYKQQIEEQEESKNSEPNKNESDKENETPVNSDNKIEEYQPKKK